MTVPANINTRTQHVGNGIAIIFAFDFLCLEAQDLAVSVDDTRLAPSQYSVSGLGAHQGGQVTFNAAPANGAQILIALEVVTARSTDYQDSGDFFARTVNPDFDRIWLAIKNAFSNVRRSLTLGQYDIDGSGSYRANGNRIKDVGAPQATTDAARKQDVIEMLADLASDGSGQFVVERLADVNPTNGAAMVGFKRASPGAVSRNLLSKSSDFISVMDFGADPTGTVSSSAAFQAALDDAAGRTVTIPDGTFIFDVPIVCDASGKGESEAPKLLGSGKFNTFLDNRTGATLLVITSGDDVQDWQQNILLDGFAITNTTAMDGTSGVKLSGIRFGKVSPRIIDQASHGLWLNSTIGDITDCMNIDFVDGDYHSNGGWGIFVDADSGVHANLNFENNRFILNGLGGLCGTSIATCTFRRNTYAYNSGPGLRITMPEGGNYSKNINIISEEWDSNAGSQISIDGAVGVCINSPFFISNAGLDTVFTAGVTMSNCRNVTINQANPRIAPGLTGIQLFVIDGSAAGTVIVNTELSSWASSGNTLYNDAGADTIIVEENRQLRGIKFPATQAPSSDPNTLDDYEEGSWTPTDVSGAGLTLASASGTYTKIGRLVTVTAQFNFPTTADAGNVRIGTLPFPAAASAVGHVLNSSASAGDTCIISVAEASISFFGASLSRRTNANYSTVAVYITITYPTT